MPTPFAQKKYAIFIIIGLAFISVDIYLYQLEQKNTFFLKELEQKIETQQKIEQTHYTHLKTLQTQQIGHLFKMVKMALQRFNQQKSNDPVNQLWSLQKTRFTLELAQLNAVAAEDPKTTLALLRMGDQFLSHSSLADGPHIRQQLSADILMLEDQINLDKMGLLNELANLEKQINQKTETLMNPHFSIKTATTTPQESGVKNQLKYYLNKIKPFFIIRKQTPTLDPILTPAYQALQRETLHFYLQEMRWSIVHSNNTLFQFSIQKCIETLQSLFQAEDIQKIMISLKKFQSIHFSDTITIPSKGLTALNLVKERS